MPGPVCLQGGGELSPACREMDAQLLARAPGVVAVLPLASAPGAEYDRATAQGVSHFRRLGAEAVAVPDPREDGGAAGLRALLDDVGLVVLPGGSPSRLLQALRDTGADALLHAHVEGGGGVLGASAGAMVLGASTVLPEEGPSLAPGIGLVPGVVVVPHWQGARDDWLAVIQEGLVLGIPEESGVIVQNGQITAVGLRDVRMITEAADLSVGHTHPAP
jgi:cyanophycinase-like exopeptidase